MIIAFVPIKDNSLRKENKKTIGTERAQGDPGGASRRSAMHNGHLSRAGL
jgi:hypothetical protein